MYFISTQTYTQILYIFSFVFVGKHYYLTFVYGENKPFNITCQRCNLFVRYSGKSGKILYIILFHTDMSNLVLYPEDINPEIFLFR